MAITVGDVLLKMGLETSSFTSGLNNTQNQVNKWVKSNQETLRQLGTSMAALGATITGSLTLATKSAVELESTQTAFEHLAETNSQSADKILKALQTASAGTVAANDLMLSANRAMTLGVAQNTEQFSSLMEIARDRARSMGLTTTQAFNDIVTGIGRGSPLILDNLGIIVDAVAANEEYAVTIGKSVDDLTEAEKQQALLNAVLEQGQSSIDKAAQSTMTASESLQALKSSVSDAVASIGEALLPIVQTLSQIIAGVIDSIQSWKKEHETLANGIVVLTAALGVAATAFGVVALALSTSTGLWVVNTAATVAHTVAALAATAAQNGLTVALQATWAVLAANPIGLAVLGVSALATALGGLAIWQSKSRSSQDALNQSTENYEPPIDTAIAKTEAWKNALIELDKQQKKLTADTNELDKVTQAIKGQQDIQEWAGQHPYFQKGTIEYQTSLLNKLSDATNGATEENKAYVESLDLSDLLPYQVTWLKQYAAALQETINIQKEQKAQNESWLDWQSKIQGLITDQDTAATKAGQLSLSLDDVAGYLIKVGKEAELAAIPVEQLADITQNAQSLAEYFQIDPSVIYQWKLQTQEIKTAAEAAEEAANKQKEDAAAVAQAIEDMHDNVKDLGDAYAYSETVAGKLGVTTDIMTGYLLKHGRSVDDIIAAYDKWGTDANIVAEKLGIALGEVAKWSEQTRDQLISDFEKTTSEAKQSVQDAVDAEKDAIDKALEAEETAHEKRLDQIQDEYDAEMESINRTLAAKLKKYSTEMDLINEQIAKLDQARTDRQNAEDKSELESQLATETDSERRLDINKELDQLILESGNETWQEERKLALQKQVEEAVYAADKVAAQQELDDYLYELEYNRQKSELEAQRDTLEDRIAAAEDAAEKEKDIARENYEYKRDLEDQTWEDFQQLQSDKKLKLEQELQETLKRYDDDLKAFQTLCDNKLTETETMVEEYNTLVDQMNRDVYITVHRVTKTSSSSDENETEGSSSSSGTYEYEGRTVVNGVVYAAEGAVVKHRPGGQLVIAGEAGEDEVITPVTKLKQFFNDLISGFEIPDSLIPAPLITDAGALGESIKNYQGGDTYVNFNFDNTVIREEADIDKLMDKAVAKLRLKGVRM